LCLKLNIAFIHLYKQLFFLKQFHKAIVNIWINLNTLETNRSNNLTMPIINQFTILLSKISAVSGFSAKITGFNKITRFNIFALNFAALLEMIQLLTLLPKILYII